jgi:hypothetical protein
VLLIRRVSGEPLSFGVLGKQLAYREMRLVIVYILQHFNLSWAKNYVPPQDLLPTLVDYGVANMPEGVLRINLTERDW